MDREAILELLHDSLRISISVDDDMSGRPSVTVELLLNDCVISTDYVYLDQPR